ncbi:hypothetical protein FRE64_01160 [Euhalothece natronophila Z-M001]|uniref:Uncharacterized protein n=1 Tax=Euhalothece natronophila Z-M001 TaxID=522448 RepID=A0A5B8NHL6_9CHRO|nr:hypothetical protein [Euhalothece natronophila]QDZ38672.1 hypothetical protein FRE64_01160 [Euhalothece natronophila Z-M001]
MVNTTSSPLTQPMDIQELGITLSAKNLNPTMVTLDNLRSLGIIPDDWELSKQPTLNQLQARLNFKNGVNIVAQQRNITFGEPINSENAKAVKSPLVAKEFVAKFAKADYQTVSVAPKTIVSFGNDATTSPRQFLIEKLIAPGPWREVGNSTPQASVNFVYQLEGCQLNISVNEVRLRAQSDPNQTVAALLFSGSFNYRSEEGSNATADLQGKIDRWSKNMESFQEIVHQKFLGQSNEGGIFPSEIMPN